MKKYHKFLILIILFFIASVLFLLSHKPVLAPENLSAYKTEEIKINGKIINVEVADTPEKQTKGLSDRQSLAENSGMLFVFSEQDYHAFWMKDMNFSLDFIWISGNEITEITKNVRPEDYQLPKTLMPKDKFDKVLEVNADVADRLNIKAGDKIEINQTNN